MTYIRKPALYSLLTFSLLFFLISCDSPMSPRMKSKHTAIGKVNTLVVIADKNIWEGAVGDTLRYFLESPVLVLPQPEPIFDLKHYTIEDLNAKSVRKELRTYLVVADLDDEDSPTRQMVIGDIGQENLRRAKENPEYSSSVGNDKWANGQILIYQFGSGHDKLIENFKRNFNSIVSRINTFDQTKIEATAFQSGNNISLSASVLDSFGIAMRIPNDFNTAFFEKDFLWIRKDNRKMTSNILLHKRPYKSQDQLTKQGIIELRDELGLRVSSSKPDSYMKVNPNDLPLILTPVSSFNHYALEVRGIWEMENDFLGGPFISYVIYNEEQGEILMADGFLFAPGEEKRDFFQELSLILSTIEW